MAGKVEAMRKVLSEQARSFLAEQRGDTIGLTVQADPRMPVEDQARVLAELRIHGAIGERDGLTIVGSGLAGRLQAERLDALFG